MLSKPPVQVPNVNRKERTNEEDPNNQNSLQDADRFGSDPPTPRTTLQQITGVEGPEPIPLHSRLCLHNDNEEQEGNEQGDPTPSTPTNPSAPLTGLALQPTKDPTRATQKSTRTAPWRDTWVHSEVPAPTARPPRMVAEVLKATEMCKMKVLKMKVLRLKRQVPQTTNQQETKHPHFSS